MMRANLLPRPKESVGAFGVEFDADHARQALTGLALVAVVTLLGTGIEQFHVRTLQTAAGQLETLLAARSAAREDSKRLALEVARYQEFERRLQMARRTGADAALAIARLGNRVPDHVWLDSLTRTDGGYDLNGGAVDVDVVGRAIAGLERALPSNTAALVSVENRSADGVRFAARIGPAK